jgi:hypothetical protein
MRLLHSQKVYFNEKVDDLSGSDAAAVECVR